MSMFDDFQKIVNHNVWGSNFAYHASGVASCENVVNFVEKNRSNREGGEKCGDI